MFNKKDVMNLEGLMILSAIKKNAAKNEAAKDLNTSVDTLNKYLKNLEAELGTKLVSTSCRGCFLTRDGENLAALANQLKAYMQSIYSSVNKNISSQVIRGEVKIAYDRNIREHIKMLEVQEFYDAYPFLSITIDTYDKVPEIGKLGYDIGLSYDIPSGNDVVVIASTERNFAFFASAEYLRHHSYPKNLDDLLENHRLIVRDDMRSWFKNFDKLVQNTRKGLCKTNNVQLVNELVSGGAGVAILPIHVAKQMAGLVCLEHLKCEALATIYLTSQRVIKDIPKVRLALDYYKKRLSEL